MILPKCTHPMYLAQSLVGNLETPDHEEAKILADVMGVPFDPLSAWGPFAPEALRPDLHGFGYVEQGQ
jgi:hypothetical protein